MKPGRNDPCPCGSGKKYKQCCLKQAEPGDEFLWRRIRRAIEGSHEQLLAFSDSHFGHKAPLAAWQELFPDENGAIDPDTPHLLVFRCWYFYQYLPDPTSASFRREALDGRTLLRAYLDKRGKKLDPLLVRYLEQCCVAPFSFYDVLTVRPDDGFVLRDIMTGEEIDVTEHSASNHAKAGDILFAMVIKIDQVALLEACGAIFFPPIEKVAILDLRKFLEDRGQPVTAALLKDYHHEILRVYLDICERLLNPVMPVLHNTDGEELIFYKLYYALECTPREALAALVQLNLSEDDESILLDAVFDPSGNLYRVNFAWEKPDDELENNDSLRDVQDKHTVCGHIRIQGENLIAEVNSKSRAQEFKALMKELLPGQARYKTTVIQSPQAMIERMEKKGDSARSRLKEMDELNSSPEVQAYLKDFLRQHYRKWLEEKLPALHGMTPMEAVKTRDGRERVEALLLDFERRGETQPLDPSILAELREKLGLT